MRTFKFLTLCFLMFGLAFALTEASHSKSIDGLVIYFSFDDGKGNTVADKSGTGNNGNLKGGAKWSTGKFGGALTLDGTDGCVEVPDSNSLQFTDGLTMVAWIKPALKGDEWQLVASKGLDAKEFFEMLLSPQGFLWMGWNFQKGRVVPAQSPKNVKADTWQQVAVAWDPSKFWNVYIDGEVLIEYPKQADKLTPNTDPLIIGTEKDMKRYYNGVIDDFALFNRGLTQDEIKGLMGGIQNILPVNETKASLTTTWGNVKQF
jgi:hypothetical protein